MKRRIEITSKWIRRKFIRSSFILICKKYGLFSLIPIIILGFDNRVKDYKREILLEDVKALKEERSLDKALISFLEERVSNGYSYTDEIEIAYWEKWKAGNDFIMLDLNAYAETLFETSDREYRGKTDYEKQPLEMAKIYYKRDSSVVANWKPVRTINPFTYSDSTETLLYVKTWVTVKRGDTLVRSFAIPLDSIVSILNK